MKFIFATLLLSLLSGCATSNQPMRFTYYRWQPDAITSTSLIVPPYSGMEIQLSSGTLERVKVDQNGLLAGIGAAAGIFTVGGGM